MTDAVTTTAAPAADTAAPATTSAPAVAPAAAPAADWTTSIADETTRAWVVAKGFKDPTALAQSTLNLEKLTGDLNSVLKVPKDDSPDAWNQVYDRLGRPKEAKEYGLKPPEGSDGKFLETASQWMHEAGLNPRQARALAEKFNGHATGLVQQQQDAIKARDTEQAAKLKADWGADFERHAALVDKACEAFGMKQEQLEALRAAMGPGDAMKFLHSVGSKLGVEGNFVNGGKGGFATMSPEMAQARLKELVSSKTFAEQFNSPDAATRAQARREKDELTRIAYPGEQVLRASR
jgi:hypothetical protein